ncbi:hypothetical protein CAP31_00300 [Sulfuriferula sp. AH1]|uniref:DUF4124 domain-containing protein n=1 Tax=Sulfuriferula sp. AH1 TaxID=1985873 RepID=UPI000B3B35F2|nr:DUF4124 domain-containing protein [Sulfuriferula sp. AH1]ARU30267.1 hypothetical protein CAP31_00300 [Sulfuriferula sp. AH1]
MKLSILVLGLCLAVPAHADIYKHIDASGQVTYTDRPVKGAKRLDLGPVATPITRNANNGNPARKNESVSTTPLNFPRVNSDIQRKRDNVRRNVLEDELHVEEQALSDAVTAKKDGEVLRPGEKATSPGYITRTERLDSNIKLHRDNINALRKELSSVK